MSQIGICARFLKDESAATAVEYVLIAGFIALVIIASVTAVGIQLSPKFNAVANNLS
jgi:pilus assembly protein Flp/PilA